MKLYTAVVKEIENQKRFSAYQITKALRDKSNSGQIFLDDVEETELDNGDIVMNILHDDVNSIVNDIFAEKVLPLSRTPGPGYYNYDLNVGPTQNISAVIPRSFPLGNVKNGAAIKSGAPNVLRGFSKSDRHNIYVKVSTYVANKRKNKELITLKGINSAVKIPGITIQDVSDVCNKLGYKVISRTPMYTSEVK